MTAIEYLDQQIKSACPNAQGVSIGRWGDKRTWRITGPVTQAEHDAARVIFEAFDRTAFEASRAPEKPVQEALAELQTKVAALEMRG